MMHINIQQLLAHYGYFGVLMILFLEMVGIPFPAETTLTFAGIEWQQGNFSLWGLILAAGIGNVLGSTAAYGIGRYWGRPVVVRFGRRVGITEERLQKAEKKMNQYQSSVLLFGKFIAGIRVLIPYIAGINGQRFTVFTIYNTISAFIWAAAFLVLGKYMGLAWNKYHGLLCAWLVPVLCLIALAVVLGYYVRRKRIRNVRRGG